MCCLLFNKCSSCPNLPASCVTVVCCSSNCSSSWPLPFFPEIVCCNLFDPSCLKSVQSSLQVFPSALPVWNCPTNVFVTRRFITTEGKTVVCKNRSRMNQFRDCAGHVCGGGEASNKFRWFCQKGSTPSPPQPQLSNPNKTQQSNTNAAKQH